MLKKFFILALALMLVLSACASGESAEINWDRDINEHWVNGEEGEKLKVAEHTLDENGVCTVCGAEINSYGEGSAEIYDYLDEEGNYPTRMTVYENGEVVIDAIAEYEFDEEGKLLHNAVYVDGKIYEEYYPQEYTSIFYEEDGSYAKKILNEAEGINVYMAYDAEGTILYEHYYQPKNDGENYLAKSVDYDYESGLKYVTELNVSGTSGKRETYDLDGNLLSYTLDEYTETGAMLYQAKYYNDVLQCELYFDLFTDADGITFSQISKEIFYNEDGGYFVYEYDENCTVINEELYDANGNKVG